MASVLGHGKGKPLLRNDVHRAGPALDNDFKYPASADLSLPDEKLQENEDTNSTKGSGL